MNILHLMKKLLVLVGSNETKIKYARKAGVKIGEGCTLLGRVEWGSEPFLITIGNDVRITSGVSFVTHDGGVHVLRREWDGHEGNPDLDIFGRIQVGNNVFIGVRSTIMPGVTIGDNVVIGAGSIVTKDIPSNTVACGVPARPIRTLEEYAEKAKKNGVPTKRMSAEEKKAFLLENFSGKNTDSCRQSDQSV